MSGDEVQAIERAWRRDVWSADARYRVERGQEGLWLIPADGGPNRLVVAAWSDFGGATWSPDQTLIAFTSVGGESTPTPRLPSGVYVVRPDGSGLRRVSTMNYANTPRWSPDGSMLAFDFDHSDVHGGKGIAVVSLAGGAARVLVHGLSGPGYRSAYSVTWLDRRTLAFVSSAARNGRQRAVDIHTIGLNGERERRVTYDCHLGTPQSDRLSGSILADTIRTFGGDDVVAGGPGPDDIGTGTGDDTVQAARDRTRDQIRCGAGKDIVIADHRDVVHGCERVLRR